MIDPESLNQEDSRIIPRVFYGKIHMRKERSEQGKEVIEKIIRCRNDGQIDFRKGFLIDDSLLSPFNGEEKIKFVVRSGANDHEPIEIVWVAPVEVEASDLD